MINVVSMTGLLESFPTFSALFIIDNFLMIKRLIKRDLRQDAG